MNDMTPIDPAAPDDTTVLFAHRRTVIDLLANTRSKTIRVALFATFICRPGPDQTGGDDSTTDASRAEIQGVFDDLDRLFTILGGRDPLEEVPDHVCKWVAGHAADNGKVLNAVKHTRDLTKEIIRATQSTNVGELEKALEAHMTYWRAGFHQTITEFCNSLWMVLDHERNHEVTAAKATAETIAITLARLAHIGKHVRLVALNASVEAARVGDAGKGLGVIAVEFKALAEEIQHLAVSASDDIEKLAIDGRNAPE